MLIPVYFYGTGAGCIAVIEDNTERSQRISVLLNLRGIDSLRAVRGI